jgi:glycosyltransferase involved in cell wall biosynthesis
VRNSLARLDRRIAVSEACITALAPYFPGEWDIVPNGIDCSLYRPLHADEERPPGPPRILFVGRFDPRNALGDLLEAAAILKGEGRDFTVQVIGDGPARPVYERKAKALGVWDRIDLMAASAVAAGAGADHEAAAAGGAAAADSSKPVAIIKEYKKALSEYQLKTVKTNLQLRMYAWAFEAVFGFAPRHVQLEEIGSSRAAVYTPAVPASDQVRISCLSSARKRACIFSHRVFWFVLLVR